jgi:hypothetical protein
MGAVNSSPPPPFFALPTPGSDVTLMSVYQPFPLRIEGAQHDACFQIGEFNMKDNPENATSIVILIPLRISPNIQKGGKFINAFASSIPNILGGTPDILTGFPDVQVTGLTSWTIADVLQSDRPFYTWKNKDGTRVVVMAEPIGIAEGDMGNIKRLPITPPGDVLHEIADAVFYKPAPPLDCTGNPIQCKKSFKIVQPPVPKTVGVSNTELIGSVLGGFSYFILTVIAVWIAITLATGYGQKAMDWIGNKLGGLLGGVAKGPPAPAPAAPAAQPPTG